MVTTTVTTPATRATAATLAAADVRKSFGAVEVLHGVSLEVHPGEILALLGENGAGKSTLVRVLGGDHVPDSGSVLFDGEDVTARLHPRLMRSKGLHLIAQETSGVETLTVAENVALGDWPRRRSLVDWRRMRRNAQAILADLGLDIDVDRQVGTLGVGQRQLIDIARALVADARVLILDEPSAALSQAEVDELFRLVLRLRDRGAGIIYITHRLPEVEVLADRVQVLRDGQTVLVADIADVDRDAIVTAMVGESVDVHDLGRTDATDSAPRATPRLALHGGVHWPAFGPVDLVAYAGEVLVLFGKIGSGTAELADSLFGLRPLDRGSIELDGVAHHFANPSAAIAAGVGFLPGDRRRCGFLGLSLASNLCAPSWRRLANAGVVTARAEAGVFHRWAEMLSVRGARRPRQPLSSLSGGNQQKILLGRWLEVSSRVLVLVEPTRGVDIKARQDIYHLIGQVADQGAAVIVATSDHEEAALVADRVLVFTAGNVVAQVVRPQITEERLLDAAIRGESVVASSAGDAA